jgi:predicted DNA-binding transcriptional regulator YafY
LIYLKEYTEFISENSFLILEEAVKQKSLEQSILDKQVIMMDYSADLDGSRTIEPVCLGFSTNGKLVLRAWLRGGVSDTANKKISPMPGWRLYRVDRITTYDPTGKSYFRKRGGYNPKGDKDMREVIVNTKF